LATLFKPNRLNSGHTAEARIALRSAASAIALPAAPCPGTEKTDKRAEPQTPHWRTRHDQPLDSNELKARIAGAMIKFDSRHALVPKVYSRHGILHSVSTPRPMRTRWPVISRPIADRCELDHTTGDFIYPCAGWQRGVGHAGPASPM